MYPEENSVNCHPLSAVEISVLKTPREYRFKDQIPELLARLRPEDIADKGPEPENLIGEKTLKAFSVDHYAKMPVETRKRAMAIHRKNPKTKGARPYCMVNTGEDAEGKLSGHAIAIHKLLLLGLPNADVAGLGTKIEAVKPSFEQDQGGSWFIKLTPCDPKAEEAKYQEELESKDN